MPQAPSQVRSATADEIRQAALQQFAQSGYDASSMRDIAASVGIKAASLYNHFDSKEKILWDLTRSAMSDLAANRDAALAQLDPAAGPRARLAAFVSAHVGFHAERRHQAVLVNSQLGSLSPSHHRKAIALRDAYENSLRAIIDAGVTTGEFVISDAQVTTLAILQMGTGVSVWFRPDGRLRSDQVGAEYVKLAALITRGIA
ncbi:MAG: TetR/AcrR family transcriptional regulator [Actinomycetota bacterium]|nr:TetR/AcrR family transcriptional regulator [Actinomycetota bacterium]